MTDRELFQLEYLFNLVFEQSADFFGVADSDGKIVFVNTAGRDVVNLPSDSDLNDLVMYDFIHPSSIEHFKKDVIEKAIESGKAEATVMFKDFKNADPLPTRINLSVIRNENDNSIKYFMAFGKNLSEHLENVKLKQLNESVQSRAKIGGWELNLETGETIWTDQVYDIYAIPKGTPTNKIQGLSNYLEKDRNKLLNYIKDCSDHGKEYEDDFEFCDEAGVRKWVRCAGWPILDDDATILGMAGTIQDVTEEKSHKERILEQKSQLDSIISNTPGMVYQFLITKEGESTFPFVSSQGFDLYEITPEQYEENKSIFIDLVYSDDAAKLGAAIEKSAQEFSQFEWTGRMKTPKGNIKYIKARSIPRQTADGILWDGFLWDVTSEKETEIELEKQMAISIHNSKLATIGELAAGVGHEINNPLAIAIGNINSLKRSLKTPGFSQEGILQSLSKVSNSLNRISTIVNGLRTFSRSGDGTVGIYDLGDAVKQSIMLVSDIFIHEGIDFILQCPDEPVYVEGNEGRIQQVIMNFITNSRDVISNQAEKRIIVSVEATGDECTTSVTDNGPGIPDMEKDKLFDAFYTSKPVGKGTGLGLAISKTIVHEHNGKIGFQTSSKGTTFKFTLPIVNESALEKSLPSDEEVDAEDEQQFDLDILIVDDEEGVREILCERLEDFGCRVKSAKDGFAALELISKIKFDIVFSDIKMPEMDGISLVKNIRKTHASQDLTVVMITGGVTLDSQSPEMKYLSDNVEGFLYKPFKERELIAILNSKVNSND